MNATPDDESTELQPDGVDVSPGDDAHESTPGTAPADDVQSADDEGQDRLWDLLAQTPLDEGERVGFTRGSLEYDCTAWSGESRRFLASTLTMRSIPHAWQGTVVVVAGDREEEVDTIVEELLGMAQAALDPDRDKVVYEVAEWSAAMQTTVAEELSNAGIEYEWDERGDLVVYADDEEAVEEVFDALPEDEGEGADDGLLVHRELDLLAEACGRVAKRVDDSGAIVDLAEVSTRLEHVRVPFGFEPAQWRQLVERAVSLRDLLDATEEQVEDATIAEAAAELRRLVRTYV